MQETCENELNFFENNFSCQENTKMQYNSRANGKDLLRINCIPILCPLISHKYLQCVFIFIYLFIFTFFKEIQKLNPREVNNLNNIGRVQISAYRKVVISVVNEISITHTLYSYFSHLSLFFFPLAVLSNTNLMGHPALFSLISWG